MKDILLWQILLDPADPDPTVLGPLLASFARLHVRQRFPWFGLLPRVLEHSDPELRALGLGGLRGADGLPAFRAIVRSLRNPDLRVRLAAVETLRESAVGHPARWAHSVFHPDPEVRRAAAARPGPPQADGYAFHLLADEACAGEVLARLGGPEPSLSMPSHALAEALEFVARGLLPRPLARRLLGQVAWDQALAWLAGSRRRGSADIDALLSASDAPPNIGAAAPDGLDELCDLFWDDGEHPSPPEVRGFWHRLAAATYGWAPDVVRRVVASIVAVAARRGRWCVDAAGVCAVFHPLLLVAAWVPREVRRGAVAALYHAGTQAPRLDDDAVKALVQSELCRRPGGSLDLWVVGGILHLVKSSPYRLLRRWVGTEAVLSSFAEDVGGSVPFLCLKDDSRRGRKDLLERIQKANPSGTGLLFALLSLAAPHEGLDFLEEMDGEQAARVLSELLPLAERPGTELTSRKATRLAQIFAERIASDYLGTFLRAWLDAPAPEESALGLATLGAVGVTSDVDRFVEVALELDPSRLRKLLGALASCASFPFGKELLLARSLAEHPDEIVRAWARARLPSEADAPPPPRVAGATVARLPEAVCRTIATCDEKDLAAALSPCSKEPSRGLSAALAARPPPRAPSAAACLALLGAHDPIEEVDAEFARFVGAGEAFFSDLEERVLRTWEREPNLPLFGHAWLHRWERHAFAAVERLIEAGGSIVRGLARAARLVTPILRAEVWEAAASTFAMWRWRDRARLVEATTSELVDALVEALPSERGEAAARTLVVLHESGVAAALLEDRRAAVSALLPDLDDATRAELTRWISSTGLTVRTAPKKRLPPPPEAELLARARSTSDLDVLSELCRHTNALLVQEATLRLIDLGAPGLGRLVALLGEDLPPAGVQAIVESVALWPDGPWILSVEALVRGSGLARELRYRLAVALFERGDRASLATALELVCLELEASEHAWFRPEDWDRLERLGTTERALALGLARSPHPHAYRRAVEALLAAPAAGDLEVAAVQSFLGAGTGRMLELRRRAARWLFDRGDASAFPLVLADALERDKPDYELLTGRPPELVRIAVASILCAGPRVGPELAACWLAGTGGVDPAARAEALERIVADGLSDTVRARAVSGIAHTRARPAKLRALGETFAWGVRIGRELTGRVFAVQMVTGKGLGHTRLTENRVFVSPLPILRREPHGRALVEALILHELGHHLYHRGEEEQKAWATAQSEGIHGLLNLCADEHLERNLRALDPAFGDRLKRLAAYAFQHSDREVAVEELLRALAGRSFEVLSGATLGVARREGCVALGSGEMLLAMEQAGLSFPRFMRALRMGLGSRHADPEVDGALALFRGGGFRRRSMAELLELARQLRAMFGWQTRLVETIGPHETVPSDPSDQIEGGEGITSQEVDDEVERVLDPKKRRRLDAGGRGKGSDGKKWINVSGEEGFETIDRVVKVPFDPAEHARCALQVVRHSRQMRRYLERLGLNLDPQRMRLRGRFDPTRTRAVVLHGDPRMLIARERKIKTDLFLGILIDCSGSMRSGDHMETAKLFGAMLAEASRAVRGIDLRVYGYTDRVIYDAGDAQRCAAHALEADGGNNDAAALWHAALAARASERRAKLLVMISDGLPTECSAAALRALVTRLTQRLRVSCAQVAVRPLAEVCFPEYIVLQEQDRDVAVRRFGGIVAKLVQRALAR